MQELLLAALGETFTAWTGKDRLLVNLEGHGREDLFEDVDLSRTVGWFVNVYPVMISTPSPWTPEAGARDVTRTLAKVPRHGLGYGLLRWMRDDEVAQTLAENPQPEVMFTYLGQLDQDLGAGMPLQRAAEVDGPAQCSDAIRPYLFEIIAFIRDGQLHVQWLTSRNRHRRETVRRLAERYVQTLKKIATSV